MCAAHPCDQPYAFAALEALIQRLRLERDATPQGTKKYETLMKLISQETDAFRATLDDDPIKF